MIPINMNAKEPYKHKSAPMGMQIIKLKINKHVSNMKRKLSNKIASINYRETK